jgi:hypothetical protein
VGAVERPSGRLSVRVQTLLRLGADPLARDPQESTALDHARRQLEWLPESARAEWRETIRVLEAAEAARGPVSADRPAGHGHP